MIYEMDIADILKLPSVDSDGSCYGPGHSWSVKSAIDNTRVDQYDYPAIMAEMEHDGYNRVPLHVDLGERMAGFYNVKIPLSMLSMLFMGNGHHRLKMMILLGFETARVTDDPSESDDTGDLKYAAGYDEWEDYE